MPVFPEKKFCIDVSSIQIQCQSTSRVIGTISDLIIRFTWPCLNTASTHENRLCSIDKTPESYPMEQLFTSYEM